MLKTILTTFALPLLLFFGPAETRSSSQKAADTRGETGTLQKMIVENGIVTMDLDVDRLIADGSLTARVQQVRFTVAANSFFPVLVFNDLLRGLEPGSIALALQNSSPAGPNAPGYNNLPAALSSSLKRLTVEKLPSGQGF